ncbi:uncharacterized protein LOC133346538 [Lethenteron reissneri]|uniref:uncharacterized protein LOC133346538 n=1 Tax=Lethenteron reissneri TaxID=7753 RepID=UPI002AB77578|nr:uncharacterized protein LOC133346538 [Lethenteron reissneri]
MEVTPRLLILFTCLFVLLLAPGHALKCHECNGVDQCNHSKPMECPADNHCITDFNGTSVAISKGCAALCPEGLFCCRKEECNKRSILLECFNCTDLACTNRTTKLCSKGGHFCFASQVYEDHVSRGCRKECPESANVTCCQKDRCNIAPGNNTSGNGASDSKASGNSQPSKSPTTNKARGNSPPGNKSSGKSAPDKGDGNSAPGLSACLPQGLGLLFMATMMRLLQG